MNSSDAPLMTRARAIVGAREYRLPAGDAHARQGGMAAKPARPSGDLAGRSVLLTGEAGTRLAVEPMLRSLGAEVFPAPGLSRALGALESMSIDLILVAVAMPQGSGLEVIQAIRAHRTCHSAASIVALAAGLAPGHRKRIAEAGADGLIPDVPMGADAFGRALAGFVRPARPAGDETAASGDPVVDPTVLEALGAAIGVEMMGELLERVRADLAVAEAALVEAVGRLDLAAIRSTSHILISVAGAIGANRLLACARGLNSAAHAGEEDGLAAKVFACLGEISAAIAFAQRQPIAG